MANENVSKEPRAEPPPQTIAAQASAGPEPVKCAVCGKDLGPADASFAVLFKRSIKGSHWEENDRKGPDPDVRYFCPDHIKDARALSDINAISAVKYIVRGDDIPQPDKPWQPRLFYRMSVDDKYSMEDLMDFHEFESCAAVTAECKKIIDQFLMTGYKRKTARVLYSDYTHSGDSPYVHTNDIACHFSADAYAMQRCKELCKDRPPMSELIKGLTDVDLSVMESSAEFLAEIGVPAIPVLVNALKDKRWSVRLCAVQGLAKIKDASVVPTLIEVLNDKSSEIRARACYELGNLKDARAIPALTNALKDENKDVREKAAEALRTIGTK